MNNLENNDIAITSRIRLARNLKNYKFPINMTEAESNCIIQEINNAVNNHSNNNTSHPSNLSDP